MKSFIVFVTVLTAQTLLGQNQENSNDRSEAQQRQQIIKRFDKDGDGRLSAEEAAAARKAMGARPAQRD